MLLRIAVATALAAVSFSSYSEEPQRGNTPPGLSQDGAKPADGAIKGGSPIMPGESAGVPSSQAKCLELSGSLREECLKKDRDAAAGSSRIPDREKDNMGAGGDEPGDKAPK
jgi:hypothetical protein